MSCCYLINKDFHITFNDIVLDITKMVQFNPAEVLNTAKQKVYGIHIMDANLGKPQSINTDEPEFGEDPPPSGPLLKLLYYHIVICVRGKGREREREKKMSNVESVENVEKAEKG